MVGPEPLHYGETYHVYNRGNNGETLFREQRNYPYFLKLYARYTEPVAETYAYCLMSNHFHLLVRIKSDRYYAALVAYIHHNLQHHGFVADFREWPYSSYWAILSDKATRLQREAVLDWFGGRRGSEELHLAETDQAAIRPLVEDDLV